MENNRAPGLWLRFGVIIACFALLISAVIIAPGLLEDEPESGITDEPSDDRTNRSVPSIGTIASSNEITGKHEKEISYGSSSSSMSSVCYAAPGFTIRTVIEAEVMEVLPDTYHRFLDRTQLRVARLRVVDQIRGEGIPDEIFLFYTHYDDTVFHGYERFILSMKQVGAENYALINETRSLVEYFPHMFTVAHTSDIGYGSVIAFNDGEVDESFWERADHWLEGDSAKDSFNKMLDSPGSHYYPASRSSKIDEVKSTVLELASDPENPYVSDPALYDHITICDFVALDDIFSGDTYDEIRSYLEPGEGNVFSYELYIYGKNISTEFIRYINGIATEDKIRVSVKLGESPEVTRTGEAYTAEDLAKLPDIADAIEKMDLPGEMPLHLDPENVRSLESAVARGYYRKIDGEIHGIIRACWQYKKAGKKVNVHATYAEFGFYLYDKDGNGYIIDKEVLAGLLAENDPIIPRD
ncbi:MAG: hypothetical protein IJY04_10505 [Clostridia bacterium]|nr:hypothetical protein [Clostridia bacterium]